MLSAAKGLFMKEASPHLQFRQNPVTVHRPTLRGLSAKVNAAHCALIVIDIQNDFCAPGGTVDREGGDTSRVREMLPTLQSLIDAARKVGVFVVFVRNAYSTEENWYLSDVWLEQASRRRNGEAFTKWDSCAPGSWQADFYDPIGPLPGEPIVTKHRYNAFHQTDLDLILRGHGYPHDHHFGHFEQYLRGKHRPRRLYARLLRGVPKRCDRRLYRGGSCRNVARD
jgi:isochorismate hydrolase